MVDQNRDVEENKVIAAIGYVWILCLVPLFLRRGSKFAQFHAKQALVLFIVEVVGWLVYWIPFFGWIFVCLLILVAAVGFFQAFSGKWWKAPVIYSLAEKITL